MLIKKEIFIYTLLFLLFICSGVVVAKDTQTLDAGLIELGEGYVKATEGFEFWYEGKRMTGEQLYLDLVTQHYYLDRVAFTACVKTEPHYLILAKRVEIIPKERLKLSGVKIMIGKVTIPLPMDLVLNYRDGSYQFPDWIPKVFYSREEGIGLSFNGLYQINPALRLQSNLTLSTRGGVDGVLNGDYRLGDGITASGRLEYDQGWAGGIGLNWRENKEGLNGKADWLWEEDGTDEKTLVFGYLHKGWKTNLKLQQKSSEDMIPSIEGSTPLWNIAGIDISLKAGLTKVKANSEFNKKVYVQTKLQDHYTLGSTSLGWKFTPMYTWIDKVETSIQGKSNLWIVAPLSDQLKLRLGYLRTDQWENEFTTAIDSYLLEESFEVKISYHYRNELDEGWDFEYDTKYSLLDGQAERRKAKVVRAYDCFDVTVETDLIEPLIDVKFSLKY